MDKRSLDNLLKNNLEKRKLCDKRGYHHIEKEPETKNSYMICYDCSLSFDKRAADYLGIVYRIEPKENKLLT